MRYVHELRQDRRREPYSCPPDRQKDTDLFPTIRAVRDRHTEWNLGMEPSDARNGHPPIACGRIDCRINGSMSLAAVTVYAKTRLRFVVRCASLV